MAKPSKRSSHKKHESERRKMQAAVGRALTAWGRIEGNLCFVFEQAIGAEDWKTSAAAFTAIINFETKMAVTRAALKTVYRKKRHVIKHFGALSEKLSDLRFKRNKLAHGVVLHPYPPAPKKPWAKFVPYWHSRHPEKLAGFPHFRTEEIDAFADQFTKAGGELWNLALALHDNDWPPAEEPEPSLVRHCNRQARRRVPRAR